nr:MAG TPA: hypothetical protein [Caudoviricetes sp.]
MKFNNTLPISKITFPGYISPKKVKERRINGRFIF